MVGIGECGLDYFKIKEYNPEYTEEDVKNKQEKLFLDQINIALEVDKPLMLHSRDSYSETLELFNKYFISNNIRLRGNAHFFAGSIEQAKAFIDCGFTISFTGVITFARNYDSLIREIPIDKILSETDCPFVAPVPHRGSRAEPIHVKLVVQKMAEIKGISEEEMMEQLKTNAIGVFFNK